MIALAHRSPAVDSLDRSAAWQHPRTDETVSASSYVASLAAEALHHRAVWHPYLVELGAGTLPDARWSLEDFARHYIGYSKHFPRYLTAVISRLDDSRHRDGLLQNLTEESGKYSSEDLEALATHGIDAEWIVDQPHPMLFQRFARAVGVDSALESEDTEADQVACWREMFMNVLTHGAPSEAVGAIGLGTENIVSTIYEPFVRALGRLGMAPRDGVFFPLHVTVDDQHKATLEAIAVDLARTAPGRRGLRRGMLKALSLRSAFWDWLYARATTRLAPN